MSEETAPVLTVQALEKVLFDCLAAGDIEGPTTEEQREAILANPDTVVVECVRSYAFSKKKLQEHCQDIHLLLNELPSDFRQNSGGGTSLMNAVADQNDNLWGEQYQADALMALGVGIDAVALCLPRNMWHALPGGMPYFVIKETA